MTIKKHLGFSSLRSFMSSLFTSLPDPRQSGKIKHRLHDVMMTAFACMYFQDKSFLQFQKRVTEVMLPGNLAKMFGIHDAPDATQIRETLDRVDSDGIRPIFKETFSRLQRGKHLEPYQVLPGLYYAAMDGTEYFSSKKISCDGCLKCEHKNGDVTYSHKVLQVAIMHPKMRQVIPLMPELIHNDDGNDKQDCEMNAAKRLIPKLRQEHPKLGLILGGDALFSKQPIIENVLSAGMHYLFVAKPSDHVYMNEYIDTARKCSGVKSITREDKKGKLYRYEWINDVPLSKRKDTIRVNYLQLTIVSIDKNGDEKINFKSSWVTDLEIHSDNVEILASTGRCRWKVENECFNTLKNQGYHLEHNYGHGAEHLAFNIYLLTLVAFLFHQVFELTDRLYQACRQKLGSKVHLWETLRAYIKILVFDTWEALLRFTLEPTRYGVSMANAP